MLQVQRQCRDASGAGWSAPLAPNSAPRGRTRRAAESANSCNPLRSPAAPAFVSALTQTQTHTKR